MICRDPRVFPEPEFICNFHTKYVTRYRNGSRAWGRTSAIAAPVGGSIDWKYYYRFYPIISVVFLQMCIGIYVRLPTMVRPPTIKHLPSNNQNGRKCSAGVNAPIQAPDCCIEQRAPCTASMHCVLLPEPISPKKPLILFCCSQVVASARRSDPMVEETQVAEVPEPSESRYWCISKKKLWDCHTLRSAQEDLPIATLLLGSVMAPNASELPDVVHAIKNKCYWSYQRQQNERLTPRSCVCL